MRKKSCYECKNFSLCRLRDRAIEFTNYINTTGNLLGHEFHLDLSTLMMASCVVSQSETIKRKRVWTPEDRRSARERLVKGQEEAKVRRAKEAA